MCIFRKNSQCFRFCKHSDLGVRGQTVEEILRHMLGHLFYGCGRLDKEHTKSDHNKINNVLCMNLKISHPKQYRLSLYTDSLFDYKCKQVQSNLNGSNIFGTIEIRSRHG